jgi:predicted transcriptional regulator
MSIEMLLDSKEVKGFSKRYGMLNVLTQENPLNMEEVSFPKTILLSVKPEYAFKIIDGIKTVELRRRFPTEGIKGGFAIIYASSPVCKIIGYVHIKEIQKLSLKRIWKKFNKQACVTKLFFFKYFDGLDEGYALEFENPVKLIKELNIKDIHGETTFSAPQSFRYVPNEFLEIITNEQS